MPITARDPSTFMAAVIASAHSIAPNVDISKGVLATLAYGFSTEGSQAEMVATYLQQLYQLSDPTLIRGDDMGELALDFGRDVNVAQVARGVVYFQRSTRPDPTKTYPVLIGTIISTSDGRFNFSVVQGNEMNGAIADVYFNSSTGRYEIPVVCEALAAGTDYNLPPNVINTIQTVQEDFDACINRDYFRGGADPLDNLQIRDLIWDTMQGTGSDVVGQLTKMLRSINTTGADAMSIVTSADFFNFARRGYVSGKFGYDVYIISDDVATQIDHGTADGGETFLPFTRKPVLAVQYVAVDGTPVAFSLDQDLTPALRGSSRASDRVQLSVALQPGQTWEMSYQYYDLVYQGTELLSGRRRILDSDVIVRLADGVDIYIAGETRLFASADSSTVLADLRTFTEGYLRDPDNPSTAYRNFVTVLDPYDYQRAVETSVNGLQQFRLTHFVRLDRAALDIERITLNGKTEYPTLAVNFDIT